MKAIKSYRLHYLVETTCGYEDCIEKFTDRSEFLARMQQLESESGEIGQGSIHDVEEIEPILTPEIALSSGRIRINGAMVGYYGKDLLTKKWYGNFRHNGTSFSNEFAKFSELREWCKESVNKYCN